MRSEKEIRQKLNFKKYNPQVTEKAISYFKKLGYINDAEFALAWVNSRLRKPLGLKAIAFELKQKGISGEIIDKIIEEKKGRQGEIKAVEALVQKYLNRPSANKEFPDKLKAKLYGYLIRRGFSNDAVTDAINQLKIKT